MRLCCSYPFHTALTRPAFPYSLYISSSALAAYQASGQPTDQLAEADRVVLAMMQVPGAEARLRSYSYKFLTPHKLTSARQVRSSLPQTSKQVQQSVC